MMQFHKLDSRRLRVTDLPSTVEGLRVDAKELEVIVSYVGDPGGRKAIVLDNVVVPLMMAAPELMAVVLLAVNYANDTKDRFSQHWDACDEESYTALLDAAEAVMSQANNEGVNA